MGGGFWGGGGGVGATGPVERIHDRIGAEERLAADAFLADTARGRHDEDDAGDLEDEDDESTGVSGEPVRGPGVLPEDLGRVAQQIAVVLDPDGPDLDDQYALQRRGLTIGRLHQGLHRITGHLLPDAAAQLQAVLDAMLNPKVDGPPHPTGVRFTPSPNEDGNTEKREGAESDRWNEDPGAVIDSRTHTQRRHDAFAAAVGIAARHADMPSLGGAAPTLVVTVDATDLASLSGRARLPGSDATIPTTAAAHTACSGVIQRVVVDRGRIVGITVTDRVFTVHQRRAIIARDTECLIPGLSCSGGVVRDPPRHRTRPRRADLHRQRGPVVLVAPPLPRHLRVGDPHEQRSPPSPRTRLAGPHPTMAHTHPHHEITSQRTDR